MLIRTAIIAILLIGCAEPGDIEPAPEPAPTPEIDPPEVPSDPDPSAHTRHYPAACREETITSDRRDVVQRTFEGDQIATETRYRDEDAIATVAYVRTPASSEKITLQHQVATRYRTIEIYDGSGRLVQEQKLRGPIDAEPNDDRCVSIETHKYPEPDRKVVELDDDCNGVDGTITTSFTDSSEIAVHDENGDGTSEVVTFSFFDQLGRPTRRVDLFSSTNSTEWNWSRSEDEERETVEYYLGAIGDTLLTRTETLRAEDGTIRSQSEYRALGDLSISRSYDDFGNPLTEVTRDGDGNQVSIKTFGYECFQGGE